MTSYDDDRKESPRATGTRPAARHEAGPPRRGASPRSYLWALSIVAVTTGAAWAAQSAGVPDVEMLFLLAVAVAAFKLGRGPSLAAAGVGVAAYDYFFVPPPFDFKPTDTRYFLTFAMMFGISVVMSSLTLRLRQQEQDASRAALRAETEELRNALLSTVSHDLRTPLAVITGAATALRDEPDVPDAVRRDLLETVCEEADRMERLVSNLLEMTRLESGSLAPNRQWVPLIEVVGSAFARLERRLETRAARTAIPEDLPLISVDPVLLEHLVVNLLENAVKHTPPGTSIELSASLHAGEIVLEVADSGPGLPTGDEERIFERFHRGPNSTAPGAGLGLPIARGIAQVHGGRLVAANRPGGGAVFRLTLPITSPAPDAPPEASGEGAA